MGDPEEGIQQALAYGERVLGLVPAGNPDVVVLRYALFPVEEARKIFDIAHRVPLRGDTKLIIISATRLFHESQNALLKVFEEPPKGVTIVLVVSSDGVLLPTLRSRLIALPHDTQNSESKNSTIYSTAPTDEGEGFLAVSGAEREKIVGKLLDKAKSDKAEEKQAARTEALALATSLMKALYPKREDPRVRAALSDLDRFIPILHERSAPLKLIFEHLLLVIP